MTDNTRRNSSSSDRGRTGNDSGNNPHSRSGSQESLQRHRREAEQGRQDYLNDPIRIQRETNPPDYSEQAFPKLSLWDKMKKKPVNLSEIHIQDTKNFLLTQESTNKTFHTLHDRGLVIKYWIDQNKSWFKAIGTSEGTYNEKKAELKKAKIEVEKSTANEMIAAGGSTSTITVSSNPEQLRANIEQYKVVFKDLLDVAHNLHRAVNGLPPLAPESQELSHAELERGVQGLQRMREEAQRQQQQQEQQLQNVQQQEIEHREEVERGNA